MTTNPLEVWQILLIDDDEDDYLLLRAMLSQAQGRKIYVDWAPNYRAGQQMLPAGGYQAVLVDYDLGGANGIQLIRELVGQGHPAPFILYTGRGGYEVDVEAMQVGATLYLAKGEATPLLLERVLRYAIERKRIEAELLQANARYQLQTEQLMVQTEELHSQAEELEVQTEELQIQTEELKSTNEQLTVAELRFRGVVESFPYGLAVYDLQLRYQYANPWLLQAGGLAWERLAGKTDAEAFGPVTVRPYQAGLQQALTSGVGHSFEWQRSPRLGGRIVNVTCVPLRDGKGQVHQLLAAMEDVTDRKQAELQLQASEARYRSLFENMAEGFAVHEILTGADGQPVDYRFLDINPAFERQTGLRRADVVGRTFSEVLPGEDQLWVQRYGQVALTGQPVRFENYAAVLQRHYEVFAFCPAPRQFAVVFTDITDRKQAEAELQAYNEQLQHSNAALLDFAFIASHDLREPLRKIQAFGERLRTDYDQQLDETAAGYVERMQQAAGRMNSMLDGLLAYSRVATQGQPFQTVDLGWLAKEVLLDLEVRLAQTGGRVELGPLPVIQADPLQMRQLLQNLLTNALKFNRPGTAPQVKVTSRLAAPGQLELTISDNGIGFDMQRAGRLFTPFTRLHQATEYEGTGMGLAICRKIVERHGGSLSASSVPGQGTTFTIRLPCKPEG